MPWYNAGKLRILDASHGEAIDLLTDTIKVILMSDAWSGFDADSTVQEHYDDVDGDGTEEIQHTASPVTNYTAGGNAIAATKSVTVNNTTDLAYFDTTTDTSWANLGGATNDTFDGIVIYKDSGVASTSPLIAQADVNTTTTNGSTITLQWDAAGILQLT